MVDVVERALGATVRKLMSELNAADQENRRLMARIEELERRLNDAERASYVRMGQ